MAYGTESIRRVDVIVGPGNRYVPRRCARSREPSGSRRPSQAPPSRGRGRPRHAGGAGRHRPGRAAEHGPDGLSWLVTWSEEKLEEVDAALDEIVAKSPRRAELEATLSSGGYACLVEGPEEAIAVANVVAPEHLELLIDDARRLLPFVQAAGAVFLGPWSPASLGDYVAGLTTCCDEPLGSLRLRVVGARLPPPHPRGRGGPRGHRAAGPHVIALATTEGLAAHAESIEARR